MNQAAKQRRRKPRPLVTLDVLGREWLTPHMVRIRLGGEGFAQFEPSGFTDSYVKLQFAPEDSHPVTRTYTVRQVNHEQRWISLDFVIHGDEGLATNWACNAEIGDQIGLKGPGGAYRPDPDADWHLFVGDETALPAIAAALETLPADATGSILVEVESPESEITLDRPDGVDLRWLAKEGTDEELRLLLASAVTELDWRPGRVHVFAHGERESIKALRDVFFKQLGLERGQVSISGYWARGRTEDRFQAEKKQPIGRISPPQD